MNLSTAEIEAEIEVLASEYSVLSKRKLWRSSLILMAAEGWEEKEICTKGGGWGSEDYACPKSSLFCKTPFTHQRSF